MAVHKKYKCGVKLSSFKALKPCLFQMDIVYCKQYIVKNDLDLHSERKIKNKPAENHPSKKIPSIIYSYTEATLNKHEIPLNKQSKKSTRDVSKNEIITASFMPLYRRGCSAYLIRENAHCCNSALKKI